MNVVSAAEHARMPATAAALQPRSSRSKGAAVARPGKQLKVRLAAAATAAVALLAGPRGGSASAPAVAGWLVRPPRRLGSRGCCGGAPRRCDDCWYRGAALDRDFGSAAAAGRRRHHHRRRRETIARAARYSTTARAATTATDADARFSSAWRVGDAVAVTRTTTATAPSPPSGGDRTAAALLGTVTEVKRGGWYTVALLANTTAPSTTTATAEDGGPTLVKCRAAQLRLPPGAVGAAAVPPPTTTTKPDPTAAAAAESTTTTTTAAAAADPIPTPLPTMASLLLQRAAITTSKEIAANARPIDVPPPPTIHDLDALLLQRAEDPALDIHHHSNQAAEYWDQVAYFATVPTWVVFTDLHCSAATMDTCLQVLDRVHAIAVARNAGIVFLGDWWHVRGTLRVDSLNRVLDRLAATYHQPMVLIPGNHDQVTAALSDNHSLTPLQTAYRVTVPASRNFADAAATDRGAVADATDTTTATTLPGLLIFSHPTVFHQALWIPHIRSPAILESVLQSDAAKAAAAVFCHADVTGASMNDNIVSHGGVPPRLFPPHKPIYSGHFHKPHTVTAVTTTATDSDVDGGGERLVRSIEYLGSPYQVSLSEAEQDKSLAVLDASRGWRCVDRIPITVGRRHFRPAALADFLALEPQQQLGAGDRVVFSIDKHALDALRRPTVNHETDTSFNGTARNATTNALDEHVARLRQAGVIVEIREVKDPPNAPRAAVEGTVDAVAAEDMSAASLWSAFLAQEVERGTLTVETQAALQLSGADVLDELQEIAGDGAGNGGGAAADDAARPYNAKATGTDFVLHSVTVQGFGPFRDRVTYPLLNRGLVLLRGANKDGGSDR